MWFNGTAAHTAFYVSDHLTTKKKGPRIKREREKHTEYERVIEREKLNWN